MVWIKILPSQHLQVENQFSPCYSRGPLQASIRDELRGTPISLLHKPGASQHRHQRTSYAYFLDASSFDKMTGFEALGMRLLWLCYVHCSFPYIAESAQVIK